MIQIYNYTHNFTQIYNSHILLNLVIPYLIPINLNAILYKSRKISQNLIIIAILSSIFINLQN